MEAATVLSTSQLQEDSSFGEESSPKEMTRNCSLYTESCNVAKVNCYCQSYVGQSKGYGVHFATSDREVYEGDRQIGTLCQ